MSRCFLSNMFSRKRQWFWVFQTNFLINEVPSSSVIFKRRHKSLQSIPLKLSNSHQQGDLTCHIPVSSNQILVDRMIKQCGCYEKPHRSDYNQLMGVKYDCTICSVLPSSPFRAAYYWRSIPTAPPTPLRMAAWRRPSHPHLLHPRPLSPRAIQRQHPLHLLHCPRRCQLRRTTIPVAPPPISVAPHLHQEVSVCTFYFFFLSSLCFLLLVFFLP